MLGELVPAPAGRSVAATARPAMEWPAAPGRTTLAGAKGFTTG